MHALQPASDSLVGVLDRRQPHAGFRTPGYPWIPAFFVLAAIYVVLSSIGANVRNAAIGSALLILGVPVYYAWRRGKAPA